jgi:hypothetical protein
VTERQITDCDAAGWLAARSASNGARRRPGMLNGSLGTETVQSLIAPPAAVIF